MENPPGEHRRRSSVAVVLVALNEVAGMPRQVPILRRLQQEKRIERVYLLDGGSTDGTPELAAELGATVIHARDVQAGYGAVLGKGDSMWRAATVLAEDVIVFLDADIDGDLATTVERLATPILDNTADFAKGYFLRTSLKPADWGDPADIPTRLGRLTEIAIRPTLAELAPHVAGIKEPLSGQVAIHRPLLQSMSIVTGYGVEIGMLLDAYEAVGPDRIADVDLGIVYHESRDDAGLEIAAKQVLTTIYRYTYDHDEIRLGARSAARIMQRAPIRRPPADEVS
jgi:glucosyl-3-phosphoglycerate synthase